jgi:hypothetical protein
MSEDFQQLKGRLVKYSDEQLIEIVSAPPGDYRQDAIDIAKAELKWRKVEIPEPDEPEEEAAAEPVEEAAAETTYDPTFLERLRPVREVVPAKGCVFCGGPVTHGTLVAEKELTVVFSDNHEERFVRVNVCTRCGRLSLVVDFETDVQQ